MRVKRKELVLGVLVSASVLMSLKMELLVAGCVMITMGLGVLWILGGGRWWLKQDWWLVLTVLAGLGFSHWRGGWMTADADWLVYLLGFYVWVGVGRLLRKGGGEWQVMIVKALAGAILGVGVAGLMSQLGWLRIPVVKLWVYKHNHLGDLLAVLLVGWSLMESGLSKKIYWVGGVMTGLGVVVSWSRSAYLGALVGWLVQERRIKSRWAGVMLAVFFLAMVVAGAQKTTLWSRAYIVQAVGVVASHPEGVGMGRFIRYSSADEKLVYGEKVKSSYAHNLWLEVGVGWGVAAMAGLLIWFLKAYWVGWSGGGRELGMVSVLLTVVMFDYVYTLPAYMLWLGLLMGGVREKTVRLTP